MRKLKTMYEYAENDVCTSWKRCLRKLKTMCAQAENDVCTKFYQMANKGILGSKQSFFE